MSLLAIETRKSVREVCAAMRTATVCSTCRDNFATGPELHASGLSLR